MGERKSDIAPSYDNDICIVLVRPEHEGNIGAVARSMLNFGLSELRIVGDRIPLTEVARNRAKNAQSVLQMTKHFDSLEDAVEDCSVTVGTSGKREDGNTTSMRHFLVPDELASKFSDSKGQKALIFGPEGKGLFNDELRKCDILLTIPSWEGYPILNLSHAVAIVCYSLFIETPNSTPHGAEERLLDPDLRVRLREEASRLVKFMPAKEHKKQGIEETLLRVIMRGLPKDDEIHRLLSVISNSADAFQWMAEQSISGSPTGPRLRSLADLE